METSKPPRYLLDRRTIGNMEVSLDVLDGMTIGGVSGAGLSAFENNIYLSVIIGIVTISLQLLKLGLRSTISKSVAINPINTTEHTTVSLPAPIAPADTATTPQPPDHA